jgi:hypothetical protein
LSVLGVCFVDGDRIVLRQIVFDARITQQPVDRRTDLGSGGGQFGDAVPLLDLHGDENRAIRIERHIADELNLDAGQQHLLPARPSPRKREYMAVARRIAARN